jgi:hypothetical protein
MAKAKKRAQSAEDVARKAFPGFEPVKRPSRDGKFLGANSKTPDEKKLHSKYGSDSAKVDAVIKKSKPDSASATQSVVVEPKGKKDSASKRLTVLVKQGKIRAVQG